jgi:hypothetical protein
LAFSTQDIERLEVRWRLRADALRKSASIPVTGEGLKALAEAELAEARDLDATADLLMGLQGCWDMGGAQMVRDGFKRMSRSYDLSKTYTLAVEAKSDAAEPGEVAA